MDGQVGQYESITKLKQWKIKRASLSVEWLYLGVKRQIRQLKFTKIDHSWLFISIRGSHPFLNVCPKKVSLKHDVLSKEGVNFTNMLCFCFKKTFLHHSPQCCCIPAASAIEQYSWSLNLVNFSGNIGETEQHLFYHLLLHFCTFH